MAPQPTAAARLPRHLRTVARPDRRARPGAALDEAQRAKRKAPPTEGAMHCQGATVELVEGRGALPQLDAVGVGHVNTQDGRRGGGRRGAADPGAHLRGALARAVAAADGQQPVALAGQDRERPPRPPRRREAAVRVFDSYDPGLSRARSSGRARPTCRRRARGGGGARRRARWSSRDAPRAPYPGAMA